jgi:hypothetical protein
MIVIIGKDAVSLAKLLMEIAMEMETDLNSINYSSKQR